MDFVRSKWAKRVKRSRPISPSPSVGSGWTLESHFICAFLLSASLCCTAYKQIRYKSDEQHILSYFARHAVWLFTIRDPVALCCLRFYKHKAYTHSDVANQTPDSFRLTSLLLPFCPFRPSDDQQGGGRMVGTSPSSIGNLSSPVCCEMLHLKLP